MTTEFLVGATLMQFCRIEEKVNSIIKSLAKDDVLTGPVLRMPLGVRLNVLRQLLSRETSGMAGREQLIERIREYSKIRNIIAHTAPYYVLEDGSEYFDIETSDGRTIHDAQELHAFYERLCVLATDIGTLDAQIEFAQNPSPAV